MSDEAALLDEYNALEHMLRKHVAEALQYYNAVLRSNGETHPSMLFITYNAGDGGTWRLHSFRPETVTEGAELQRVVRGHVATVVQHNSLQVLRGSIEHTPSNDA